MLRLPAVLAVCVAAGALVALPATATEKRPPSRLACYEGNVPVPDLKLTGRITTLENLSAYTSTDGTCTGVPLPPGTAAAASTNDDALRKCHGLGDFNYATQLVTVWPTMPSDWYICQNV